MMQCHGIASSWRGKILYCLKLEHDYNRNDMRFEFHKNCRFNNPTNEEFQKAQREYYAHLKRIDFKGRKTLLRYFGGSFFHDADVVDIIIAPETRSFSIRLYRRDDREDINDFRRKNNLKTIGYKIYVQNPVQYLCTFKGVDKIVLKGSLDFSESVLVMDTELDFNHKNGAFIIRVSFSETDEYEVHFHGAVTVRTDSEQLISKLLGGLRKHIPYCRQCRSKILSYTTWTPSGTK
jgi:hypothetical protein